jgi:glycosyltransferase involved in cell wall biosynthesis
MPDNRNPLISVIIPTRNEAADIAHSLEACLALRYEPKEIIVVDDSTDGTPQIVSTYAPRGVRLIHREHNDNGCCGARNLGMKMANGEIVVVLNADNVPQPDFLDRLLPHYHDGADYVIVRSLVMNRDNLWGEYTYATNMAWLSTQPNMEWSEGFSCRRAAAEAVGYIPGYFPVPFCRDWKIGEALNRAGFKKHIDLNIPMEHVTPDTLKTYWHNQIWRGTFSSPHAYYFGHKPLPIILLREVLKAGRAALCYLLVVPALITAARISTHTNRGWRAVPSLFWAGLVQSVATSVGNFKGFKQLTDTLRRETIRSKSQEASLT